MVENFRSGVIRMGRWHCYSLMLIHQASFIGWILLGVTVAIAVIGFLYSPWTGLLALSIDAFLVVLAMSFVIMAYGIGSVTGVNLKEHTLSLNGDRIFVEFEEGKPIEIQRALVRPYSIYPGGVLIPVDDKVPGWLWVPPKAFETPADFERFLKIMYNNDASNTK